MDKSGVRKELSEFVTDFRKFGPFAYIKTEVTQTLTYMPLWPFNYHVTLQLCIVNKQENHMDRIEKIEKGLAQIGKNIRTNETLGGFAMGKKVELAEQSTRLAYAVLTAVVDELKDLKANEKHQ